MRAYENSITVDVHCCDEGEWSQDRMAREQFSEFCQVKLNAPSAAASSTADGDANDPAADASASVSAFVSYVEPFLVPQSIQQSLPPSDVVGNIRFSHPTLYVFPGGQGDSALFGINGFNMLIDGGFSRK